MPLEPTAVPLEDADPPKLTPLTVRISGLPNAITTSELRNLLNDLHKPARRNLLQLSLAPELAGRLKKTATVSFRDVPRELKNCRQSAVTLSVPLPDSGEELDLQFDSHFFGLTPLYTPDNPAVDIVAVTLLAGNAFGSWSSSVGQKMWLRDYLPGDLENQDLQARIMTYGYDSRLDKSQSYATIHDYSRRLLEALKNARPTPTEQRRPIIFLGHSFGGILIKHALKEAMSGAPKDKLILESTYALLFFGVPNRGIEIASLATMVSNQPNEELLRNLGPNSHLLPELEREFTRVFSSYQDSKVLSFYETKKTPTVQKTATGAWARTGEPILMVTSNSATKSAPGEQFHDQLPLDGNHLSMVKFQSSDVEDYITVSGRILDLVEEGPAVIEKRFSGTRQKRISTRDFWEFAGLLQNEEFFTREKKGEREIRSGMDCDDGGDRTVRAEEVTLVL